MNLSLDRENLEACYRYCHDLCRDFQSNFFKTFHLLPANKRSAMCVLYAFNRLTDDLADSFSVTNAQDAGPHTLSERQRRIRWWRSMTRLALQHDFTREDQTQCLAISTDTEFNLSAMMILPALADIAEQYQIPGKHLTDVIDGVEMDLTKTRYETFAELEIYCQRVASSVGLACIHIWDFEGRGTPEQEKVYEHARRVGIAYQLTNILRDLKEDAALDRVYLPLDEIAAADYSAEALKNGVANSHFEILMHRQIERAEDFYRASPELYGWLKPESKKIFGLMTATYHTILRKIATNPSAVFTKRLRPGVFDRLRLGVKWSCCAPRELVL